ncbi:MAG: hypothetical protein ACFCU6_11735 [Balneolaceae bacterium]
MKYPILGLLILFCSSTYADAQLREDLRSYDAFSGTVTHAQSPKSGPGNFMNMLNMTMSHSYTMSFSNFGGQMQNLNAYTNHMAFDLTDKLDAYVDVSVIHSPFGNSFMNNDSAFGAQIVIDRAMINYQLSPNTNISFSFSQRPYYSPHGSSFFNSGFGRSRFGY